MTLVHDVTLGIDSHLSAYLYQWWSRGVHILWITNIKRAIFNSTSSSTCIARKTQVLAMLAMFFSAYLVRIWIISPTSMTVWMIEPSCTIFVWTILIFALFFLSASIWFLSHCASFLTFRLFWIVDKFLTIFILLFKRWTSIHHSRQYEVFD